ncbi:MAG: tRNA (cytidine(34)-2'-O)-methyltransferase [Raoultibacter sp.]
MSGLNTPGAPPAPGAPSAPNALNIVLFEPEIPQNTGNIARTCACIGATLHLVEPMGFRLTEKNLGRAGLDYWDKVEIVRHACTADFLKQHAEDALFFFTGHAQRSFAALDYGAPTHPVYLVFGRESRGIDADILAAHAAQCVRIPMRDSLRSLNLSNAVAIAAYEVLRQRAFPGMA